MNKEQFFTSIQGKTVTFCGIGRSHMPLIRLFQEKGALVSAGISAPWRSWGTTARPFRSGASSSSWGKTTWRICGRTSSSAPRG